MEGQKKTTIFPVSYSLGEIKENITIKTNTTSILTKEQIINNALKFHSQGNLIQASKYYQLFINQGFKDCMIFCNYGVILKNNGNLKEAEILYNKAIKLNPDYAEAYSNLGNISKDLGNLKEAEILYNKAIKINPNYAEAHSNLGNILKDLNKLKEAEISLRKAILIKPNLAIAHQQLGEILIKLGKYNEAQTSSLKAIEIDPELIESHRNLEHLKINCNDIHKTYCDFCGKDRECNVIKSNIQSNRYTDAILSANSSQSKQIERHKLFSRLCFRCSYCGSQFYNPTLSNDLFDKVYKTEPVFHHDGWWSFYNSHLNSNELFLKEKKHFIEVLNISNNYISNSIGIYCEVNCPFQGIVKVFNFDSKDIILENKSLSDKFRKSERILAIEQSNEIWGNECKFTLSTKEQEQIKEENKTLKCREKAISTKLFHSILNFQSEVLINKIKENKNSTNIIVFAHTLDHLPNPLLSLSKAIELFDLILITLHTYNPKEGPTMQHKMQIGNQYTNWKNLIKTPCEIYDLSKILSMKVGLSQKKCDRLILIKKK